PSPAGRAPARPNRGPPIPPPGGRQQCPGPPHPPSRPPPPLPPSVRDCYTLDRNFRELRITIGSMLEYRVEELADEAGVSVDVLRSYQSKGLLPPPRHVGRLALYGERHLDRLRTIRDLKARGHSLRAIASLLNDPAPERRRPTLAEELAGDQERLSLVELAERTRVPPAMLRSLEGSRVLRPLRVRGEPTYTAADVRAVRMLLSLV